MTIQIAAKFDSKCGVCKKEWKTGTQIHYSKEFKTACVDLQCLLKRITPPSNPSQSVLTTQQSSGSVTPTVKTLDVVDIALDKLKREALVDLKVIVAREEVVRDYFVSEGDNNPNPEKVGLYLKLLSDMYRHDN